MDSFWDARRGVTPKLTASALFLCTAVSIACALLRIPNGLGGTTSEHLAEGAAIASPLVFLCACVLVFSRPHFGYVLGLIAGLIALPWFVGTELSFAPENSWIYLNIADARDREVLAFLAFVKLRILSMALIVVTLACSSLRLLPAHWLLRKSPLCRRTWPALAVSFVVLVVWFVHSAMPYRVPRGCGRGNGADVRILHVEKRGLRFHETVVSATRDGKAWVSRNDRWLFQYRFEVRVALIFLGETSQTAHEHARAFVRSPELLSLHTQPARALRSWNAEGWYVLLNQSQLLAFTSEYRTAPPQEVTNLFHEIERLPASEERVSAVQDVCLGFCYDPLAELGLR